MVWALALLTGCGGGDKLLKDLDGAWTGTATTAQGTYGVNATFTFTDYLAGEITVQEPGGAMVYAVRRGEEYRGIVSLDCLLSDGGLRALDLDGELDGDSFTGAITVTWDCEQGSCGYEGDYTLSRAALPPGGTGAVTPTPPDDTGTTPTPTTPTGTTSDTGSTPGGTGAVTP